MANINAAGQTHDQLQAACWLRAQQLYYPFMEQRLFCVPNDMHAGNVVRWKQYEALGVTPGVWDMQLIWFTQIDPYEQFGDPIAEKIILPAVHWFEFKVGKDALSDAQLKFQSRMEKIWHCFHVVSDEEAFMSNLKLIIEPTLHIAKQIWKEELEKTDGPKRIKSKPINTKRH